MTPDEEDRLEQLGGEAQRLAKAGRCAEAEEIARSIPTSSEHTGYLHEKVIAFIELGRSLIKEGQATRARAILAEAEQLAAHMRDANWEEADALYDIGEIWRDAGDAAEAL